MSRLIKNLKFYYHMYRAEQLVKEAETLLVKVKKVGENAKKHKDKAQELYKEIAL